MSSILQLLTVAEFQTTNQKVFRTEQAVYQAVREGLIPHCHIGRKVFIDPEQWRKFVAEGGKSLSGGWRRKASGQATEGP